jgi:hypothetical protein
MNKLYIVTSIDRKIVSQNTYNEKELRNAAKKYLGQMEILDQEEYFGFKVINDENIIEDMLIVPDDLPIPELVSRMLKIQEDNYGWGWLFVTKITGENLNTLKMT